MIILILQGLILLAILPTIAGCRGDVVEIAREAADRQASQNTEMIRLNREVAAGTERLVEADAQSLRSLLLAYRLWASSEPRS